MRKYLTFLAGAALLFLCVKAVSLRFYNAAAAELDPHASQQMGAGQEDWENGPGAAFSQASSDAQAAAGSMDSFGGQNDADGQTSQLAYGTDSSGTAPVLPMLPSDEDEAGESGAESGIKAFSGLLPSDDGGGNNAAGNAADTGVSSGNIFPILPGVQNSDNGNASMNPGPHQDMSEASFWQNPSQGEDNSEDGNVQGEGAGSGIAGQEFSEAQEAGEGTEEQEAGTQAVIPEAQDDGSSSQTGSQEGDGSRQPERQEEGDGSSWQPEAQEGDGSSRQEAAGDDSGAGEEENPASMEIPDPLAAIPYGYELPLVGATGFSQVELTFGQSRLKRGEAFSILGELENTLLIRLQDGMEGEIDKSYCLVNLPDILPSIIYENNNGHISLFTSGGYDLPGISFQKLYHSTYYNNRFGMNRDVVPVLFEMTKKVAAAQKNALRQGDCLKLYEAYRPYEVEENVHNALSALIRENRAARDYVNRDQQGGRWGENWFMDRNYYSHQRGCAIDVGLVKILRSEVREMDGYTYLSAKSFRDYEMPSRVHDLSTRSVILSKTADRMERDSWRNIAPAQGATDGALRLQQYCANAGMTPLASEWWHFVDLDAYRLTRNTSGHGRYYLEGCSSF